MENTSKTTKSRKLNEKTLNALLSVGVAVLLWLYVVTVVSPNSDTRVEDVPITLQGIAVLQDRQLMITTEELPVVDLHLEGNRTDLNKLNSSNISISADVSGIGAAGTYDLKLGNPSFPADVPNTSITVLDKTPATIRIEVEERKKKEVPVDIRYLEEKFDSENYLADKENRVLDKATVTVSGPKSVIDQIAMARIDVDLNSRVESLEQSYAYTLCNQKGEPVDVEKVQTDTEAVLLSLKIVRVKEVPLVPQQIIYGGGATAENTEITMELEKILVSGSDAMLAGLEKIELDAIDLSQIPEDTELVFPIVLQEGITNETGVTEVKVKVKFNGLATKNVIVSNIETINEPAELLVIPAAKQLEITLRGPEKLLEKVTPEQVKVQLDCTNAQLGNASIKAVVTVSAEGVGALGTYHVTATVEQKP